MKKNLYVMYAIAGLQGMVFYGPVATLYRQAQSITVFQITVIESVSLLFGILLEVPWGIVADKIGYRKTLICCSVLYWISKLIFWRATSFPAFLSERLILSVALAGLSGVDSSILYLSCQGKDCQKVFGLYHSFSMAGLFLAAGVFSVFLQDNYSLAGLLTVVSYGIAALLSFVTTEVKQTDMEERKSEPIWKTLQLIGKDRRLLLFLIAVAFFSETHQIVTVFLNQLRSGAFHDWSALYGSDYVRIARRLLLFCHQTGGNTWFFFALLWFGSCLLLYTFVDTECHAVRGWDFHPTGLQCAFSAVPVRNPE